MASIDLRPSAPTTRELEVMRERVPAELPPSGEMTLAEALQFAVRIQRAGDLENAEKIYRSLLAAMPEQPDALNFLAMIELHKGNRDGAIELMRRSLAADPDHGERYNNLGNLLLAAERVDEAAKAYEEAIARSPATAAAHNNLGILYRAQGRFDEAEREYQRALEIDPANVEAWTNYGNLHAVRGEPRTALRHYGKALSLRPTDPATKRHMALAYVATGDLESAAALYREWLESNPDDHGVRHLLAAVSGEGVPARAGDEYVESTFDNFAARFDAKLAVLGYRAPEIVAAAVDRAVLARDKRLAVLDAGCGTGLCGPLLAPYAATLAGVDLSGGMLERASSRGVYDQLVKAELTQFLQSRREEYDLIVSADTLCYFGSLDDVTKAAAGALRPGGWLIYTVERAEQESAPEGHRINPHGRYSHTPEYVERTLASAGFALIEIVEDVLRQELSQPVNGLVVTARKARPNAVE